MPTKWRRSRERGTMCYRPAIQYRQKTHLLLPWREVENDVGPLQAGGPWSGPRPRWERCRETEAHLGRVLRTNGPTGEDDPARNELEVVKNRKQCRKGEASAE